jgi:hypothetical protein
LLITCKIGEFDEDGEISMEESILIGEVDEDGKIVLDDTHARYHKSSYLFCCFLCTG